MVGFISPANMALVARPDMPSGSQPPADLVVQLADEMNACAIKQMLPNGAAYILAGTIAQQHVVPSHIQSPRSPSHSSRCSHPSHHSPAPNESKVEKSFVAS